MKTKIKIIVGLCIVAILLSGCGEISTFFYGFEPYSSGYNPFKHRCLEVELGDWREDSLGTATFHTWEEVEEEVNYFYGDLDSNGVQRSDHWVKYKPRGNITDWCTKIEREDYSYYDCDFLCYKSIDAELWTKESLRLAKEDDKFLLDCARYENR